MQYPDARRDNIAAGIMKNIGTLELLKPIELNEAIVENMKILRNVFHHLFFTNPLLNFIALIPDLLLTRGI